MKKSILSVLVLLVTVVTLSAQNWTLNAVTPLPYDQNLLNSVKSHAVLGENLYFVTTNSGATTVVVYNTTTQVVDTVLGGESLPISSAVCKISPDSTLWVVGSGVNCDSTIWYTSLTAGVPGALQYLAGPHFRPGSAKYAWVKSVEFLENDVYFAGRWDSVGSIRAPNLIRWSKTMQQFSIPPQVGLMNINANPNNAAVAAKFAKLSAPGTIMVSLPFRNDSILVITGQNTGYVQKLTAPTLAGYNGTTPYDPISYKGDLYFSTYDLDPNTLDVVWFRILKRNHSTGTVEAVAQLANGPWYADRILDVDTLSGKLIMVMEYGFSTNALDSKRFYPVMAYDSTTFTAVVDSVSDAGTYQTSFSSLSGQCLFGRGVTYANGVVGIGFYQLAYADTSAPVITLVGADTITLEKGDSYTELGAVAVDNEDGTITNQIVVTGTVDTGAVGVYTITYTVTDAAGNTASVTRTVIVRAPNAISEATYLKQVTVFPDRIVVAPTESIRITIISVTGQVTVNELCNETTTFEFSGWSQGIYLAVLNQKTAVKFVVR